MFAGAGQGFDEQGVAVAAFVDAAYGVRAGFCAEDGGQLAGDVVAVEAFQAQHGGARAARQLGQQGAELPVGGAGRAVGDREQDAGLGEVPGQEAEQLAGGGVGPVQVLDEDDEGPVGGHAFDEREDLLVQAVLAAFGLARLAELGEPAGQLPVGAGQHAVQADQAAQYGDERRVRQGVAAELGAGALGHAHAGPE